MSGPIRDALENLTRAWQRAGVLPIPTDATYAELRLPVILLPANEWIAAQNAAIFEAGSVDGSKYRPDEFTYAGYVFRVDRGARRNAGPCPHEWGALGEYREICRKCGATRGVAHGE